MLIQKFQNDFWIKAVKAYEELKSKNRVNPKIKKCVSINMMD